MGMANEKLLSPKGVRSLDAGIWRVFFLWKEKKSNKDAWILEWTEMNNSGWVRNGRR